VSRIRVASVALRWILAVSLNAAPLIAQQSSQAPVVVSAHRPVVQVLDENNNPVVGGTILSTLTETAQAPNADRTATKLGAPRQPAGNPGNRAEPGGKTWSTAIIAALIAGAVVALILLLDDDDPKKPGPVIPHNPPTGTILAPGTPSVTVPH